MKTLGYFIMMIAAVVMGMFLYGVICDEIAGSPAMQEIVFPQD